MQIEEAAEQEKAALAALNAAKIKKQLLLWHQLETAVNGKPDYMGMAKHLQEDFEHPAIDAETFRKIRACTEELTQAAVASAQFAQLQTELKQSQELAASLREELKARQAPPVGALVGVGYDPTKRAQQFFFLPTPWMS